LSLAHGRAGVLYQWLRVAQPEQFPSWLIWNNS
jgi:hypothetical protein